MKNKIIFLDVDGVLNSQNYMNFVYNCMDIRDDDIIFYDERCIKILEYIIKKTNCKIVISSSWKQGGANILIRKFNQLGLNDIIIGITPSLNNYRGIEIEEYIKENKNAIESFAILDDDRDLKPYLNRLIKTDVNFGLLWAHVKPIIELLNIPIKLNDDNYEDECWNPLIKSDIIYFEC